MEKWQKQIQKGMELIKKGCNANQYGFYCHKCPFIDFCDLIHKHTNLTPEKWESKK